MSQSRNRLSLSPKLVTQAELAALSASMRERGLRLVLTNGCFDLLHVGHVRYLREARASGDALAIGLNTDSSIRRLKGADRPIMAQQDRAEILAALSTVDFITLFDDSTAENLVELVKPSVYVKGGDYSDDPSSERFPPEGFIVRRHGGKVRALDFVSGYSSSSILERIRRSTGTLDRTTKDSVELCGDPS